MDESNNEKTRELIVRWREDPNGTYQTWFLWEERLKNFRSIRRGIAEVVREIEAREFGNVYKGSSLETVVGSIAEQRRVFKGADHAFLWKPKLRIPDIYENPENQLAFGRFLKVCHCCSQEEQILEAIRVLDARKIKGLGPACANLLYFLHPTFVPPFNTAIVKGFNKLAGANVKLGKWQDFLAMRERIVRLNIEHRDILSNDFGAIGGLLFDIGSGRYILEGQHSDSVWKEDLDRVRTEAQKALASAVSTSEQATHSEVQAWLRDLGLALGYDVWIAANDQGRQFNGQRLDCGCLQALPDSIETVHGADAIKLIDVIWLDKNTNLVSAAFEVEHSTSIYSGIVRLLDLALSTAGQALNGVFLVAPNDREEQVRAQIKRPAFSKINDLKLRYLSYGDLKANREAMARFGHGMKAVEAIARSL